MALSVGTGQAKWGSVQGQGGLHAGLSESLPAHLSGLDLTVCRPGKAAYFFSNSALHHVWDGPVLALNELRPPGAMTEGTLEVLEQGLGLWPQSCRR